MLLLAIETSCDETSLALLKNSQKDIENSLLNRINNTKVIASLISSQIKVHSQYGGVIPEIGAREHAKNIHDLFNKLLLAASQKLNIEQADILQKINTIYVTTNPGLVSSLKVGLEFAKSLRFFLKESLDVDTKIIPINHLEGHLISCFYSPDNFYSLEPKPDTKYLQSNAEIFPHLHLLVSGGHTQLMIVEENKYSIIGQTLDDAAGECLDKVGRMLGLPYPGGIWISKIAKTLEKNYLNLPIGMHKKKTLNFSYSGLKTAVRYLIQKQNFKNWSFEKKLSPQDLEILINFQQNQVKDPLGENIWLKGDQEYLEFIYQLAVSTQQVVVAQLNKKLEIAIKQFQPKSIGLSGGVSANSLLRKKVQQANKNNFISPKPITGDNAIMIGLRGEFETCLNS